jgi:hypothetical protein
MITSKLSFHPVRSSFIKCEGRLKKRNPAKQQANSNTIRFLQPLEGRQKYDLDG